MNDVLEVLPYPKSSADERGWVIRPIYNELGDFPVRENDEGIGEVRNLHIVSMVPGSVRGNHYHKHQLEFLLIMGGSVELVWQNPGETEKHRQKLDTHDPVVLRVPPDVRHAIKNTSSEAVFVVCYSKFYELFPGQDVAKVKGFFEEK